MTRVPALLAIVAASALAIVGVAFGTFAAGGSDSSCYALMADAFAHGMVEPSSGLALEVPWPNASSTFAPGGFAASRSHVGGAAPVCAPGFSLLLAPFVKLGGPQALFAVTPIAGALLVWLAFRVAAALGGAVAGVVASVLIATSPIVLFQVVQPMNDITTAMLWMAVFAALVSRRSVLAGVCCGLALLVRPNLALLAVVAACYAFVTASTCRHDGPPREWFRRAAVFAAAAAPFVAIILWLNNALYGGPWRSGYGQLGHLFSVGNVAINAPRYWGWLMQTQTPLILLGLFAPLVVSRPRRSSVWLALALASATAVTYLGYTPFDDWSYLRFLLPGLAILVVLMSVVFADIAVRTGPRVGLVILAVATCALALSNVVVARDRLAFRMQSLEQRYRSVGIVVRDHLPAGAAVFATWDSGAIRFHAGRDAIVWDAMDPGWLDRAIAWLEDHGHPPYIVVESWEEPGFRARFAATSQIGNLDWPPRYEVDRVVRIYDPSDRARYLRGEHIGTEYLWPLRR
jgi:Dolichyl-phosphate-mannose-protein mannosyltransferase